LIADAFALNQSIFKFNSNIYYIFNLYFGKFYYSYEFYNLLNIVNFTQNIALFILWH